MLLKKYFFGGWAIHKYDFMKCHVFHQELTDYVIRALLRTVIHLHGDVQMLGVAAA